MQFAEAKLIYQYFETGYDLHEEVASFNNEEIAIQFGVKNLVDNRGKRVDQTDLYDLEITIVYDSLDSFEESPHDNMFWDQYEINITRIEDEIGRRYKELYKKEK